MYLQHLVLIGIGFVAVLAEPLEKPTVPTECNDANQGRCECGDTSKGFTTYTFWLDGEQRCFTVYRPKERANEKLPVLVTPNCYGKDKLKAIGMKRTSDDINIAANRYGFARIGISSPSGGWSFGNNGIVNDTIPMPYSVSENKNIKYAAVIAEWIAANPDKYDAEKIWIHGHSQNGAWTQVLGFAFSDYVKGIYVTGSGLSENYKEPAKPTCQAHVSEPQKTECKEQGIPCSRCPLKCTDCQYWPIYPCYSPVKPMTACLMAYENDYSAEITSDPDQSTNLYMYQRMKDEGHDPRRFRFAVPEDGSIAGGHTTKSPRNTVYWMVGCLGMTEQCSQECESALVNCVEASDTSTALKRTKSFAACMQPSNFSGLEGCVADCAPTFNMLASSENPQIATFERFGAGPVEPVERPETSKCTTAEEMANLFE